MIGPEDVRRWADSLFADFLRSLVSGAEFFPKRRDKLGRVAAKADAESFLREAEPLWNGSKGVIGKGYRVELKRMNRQTRGAQNEPVAVTIDSREDFLDVVGRREDVEDFERDARELVQAFPESKSLLLADPSLIVSNAGAWPDILSVVRRFLESPRPGCHVRAFDVPLSTKFIEDHSAGIEALLALLPTSGYNPSGASFSARCGFAEDSASIRARFLCPALQAECGFPVDDVELRIDGWRQMRIPADAKVVVCENKANFLALPQLPRTIAFWGQGGAASGNLPKVGWLADVQLVYWGDMDPTGFAILAKLRSRLPRVESVLMDEATLATNSDRVSGAKPASGAVMIEFLSTDERAAFDAIATPAYGLEQERLIFRDGLSAVRSKLFQDGQQD